MNRLNTIPTVDMSREDWLKHRQQHIGGSDAAALLGFNPYSSPLAVYMDKLGLTSEKPDSEAAKLGRFLEEYVAQRFTEETGKTVRRRNAILINPDIPFAHANVDRMIVGEDAGLECKTTSELNIRRFKDGEYPENYYAQCVHYMMVTGADRWYLAVLIGNKEFKIFVIERNEEEIEALKQVERDFWENNVIKCIPPAVSGSKADAKILADVYTGDDGEAIDLTEIATVFEILENATERRKAAESEEEYCKQIIQATMKNATEGYTARYVATWKKQERKTLDIKKLLNKYPNIEIGDCYKLSTFRTFKYKTI